MSISSCDLKADIAVIMGSGLSFSESSAHFDLIADYRDNDYLPVPTVEGHPGRIAYFRSRKGAGVLLFLGRSHLYEGVTFEGAGAAVRAAAAMGCSKVLITNAAGCLRPDIPLGSWLAAGSVVALPFRRRRIDPDREGRYRFGRGGYISAGFRRMVVSSAARAGLKLFHGNLFWNTGPCYETPAEARAARLTGADAVTMSVFPELTAAGETGIRAAVLSCLTNYTPNIPSAAPSHRDVVERCGMERDRLIKLISLLSEAAGEGP